VLSNPHRIARVAPPPLELFGTEGLAPGAAPAPEAILPFLRWLVAAGARALRDLFFPPNAMRAGYGPRDGAVIVAFTVGANLGGRHPVTLRGALKVPSWCTNAQRLRRWVGSGGRMRRVSRRRRACINRGRSGEELNPVRPSPHHSRQAWSSNRQQLPIITTGSPT